MLENTTKAALVKEQEALARAVKRAEKEVVKLAEWEEKTVARNPRYVKGSVRKPTEADLAILGHCHGLVCSIVCDSCGEVRVVNKQDAFQVRFCGVCRKAAQKEASKERRAEKKASGMSKEEIEAKIAELTAKLATKAAA